MNDRKENSTAKICAHIVLICGSLMVLLPLIWVLLTSFKTRAEAYVIPPKLIFQPTLDNYKALVDKYPFGRYFLNSLTVASITSVIVLLVGSTGAYAISRFKAGGNFIVGWLLNSRTLPPIVMAIPFVLMFQTLHLDQTLTSLIIANLAFTFPLATMLMVSYFGAIPVEVEEAARVDGCNRWHVLFRIVLPLAGPGIASTGIITFVLVWNEFLFALLLTGGNTRTLPVAVANFLTNQGVLLGELSAACMVLIVPAIALSLMVRNRFVEGIATGSYR